MENSKIIKLSDDMDKQVFACGNIVQDSICSIYTLDGCGQPQLTGTAVLLNIKDYFFLISAAHVLSDNGPELFFPYMKDLHGIEGINHSTSIAKLSSREDDKVDFSIFELKTPTKEKFINEYKFLGIDDIEINHINRNNRVYFGLGYPHEITTVNPLSLKISEYKYIFWSFEADLEKYTLVDCERHSHIVLKFMNNQYYNYSNPKKTAPAPYGMSGGGLWCMKNLINPDLSNIDYKLVGILIEYHDWAEIVVSIKFHLITETIRKFYPELSEYIPVSRITKVNIDSDETLNSD